MLLKVWSWLKGYLIIQIQGISPERFINLCSYRRIYIWKLIKVNEKYQFNISINNFKKIKPIVRKTGIVPRIIEKKGFPFFIQKNKKRKVFFIGIIACSILVYIMSLFIWDISVVGGYKYTPEALIKFLDENQVYCGIRKNKVDCKKIEDSIRLDYKDIGWVSAEIKGTRLIIKITETNMPTPGQKPQEASHIVASKDGIIISIITQTGVPQVRPGDVFKKGDILVSGILEIMSDFEEILDKKPVIASATIRCKSYYDYKDSFSMNYTRKIFTGKTKKSYYVSYLYNKLFIYNPRYSYDNYDIIIDEKKFGITDTFYLPFRYGSLLAKEFKEERGQYTKEEALEIGKSRFQSYLDKLIENDVSIIDNNVTISIKNNKCVAEGRIFVEEPAWEYKRIDQDEWRMEQIDELDGDNN